MGSICGDSLPDWVRARIDKNFKDNAERFTNLKAAFLELCTGIRARQIDFALLKGFAHSPDFTPDPRLRAQGDIDLWCLPERVDEARAVATELGYRPIAESRGRHLPPMARETKWEWRGDYFAVDLPIALELHYCLWDEKMESIPGPPEQELWMRRSVIEVDGAAVPVLARPDALAFSTLHLMMHLLHGDLRLQRAWEIGHFLHHRAADESFWQNWRCLHSEELRRLHVTIFCLVEEWFGCRLPAIVEEEKRQFPADLQLWLRHYSLSPVEALFVPNKHELWLNMCLVNSFRDRRRIFVRRLLPAPNRASNENRKHHRKFLYKRAIHHARTLLPTCLGALKWWWRRQQLDRNFLRYLVASTFFNFGEFVFFLLYNLFLLDQGYREDFLGRVAGAVTAGTFAGVIPAAALSRRFGLRGSIGLAIVGTTSATAFRAVARGEPALLISAFLNGLFMSLWAVSLPPAIAGFTSERNRPLAFSVITSSAIGIGVLAGFVGGHLPAWLIQLHLSLSQVASKRLALLLGSAIAALAIFPAATLRFRRVEEETAAKQIYPRNKFILAFLSALFIWNIGTAGFNPFFNAYFARHLHFSIESIGSVFSYGQLTQVFVILLAPALFRKIGETRSVAGMQIATAAMLGLIAITTNPVAATFVYIAYMSFQYMSSPCLFSMLMNHVPTPQRSGASALNFLITSLAGIFAALAAGAMITKLGYPTLIALCAITTCAAGLLFWSLVSQPIKISSIQIQR